MHGPTCIFWANLTPFSLQFGMPHPLPPALAAELEAADCWTPCKFPAQLDHQVRSRQVGPEVGPTSVFSSCVPTVMCEPTCIFWANVTTCLLQASHTAERLGISDVELPDPPTMAPPAPPPAALAAAAAVVGRRPPQSRPLDIAIPADPLEAEATTRASPGNTVSHTFSPWNLPTTLCGAHY